MTDGHRQSRVERIDIRGVGYNVRHWGDEGAPAVIFLHGWMDCSPSFQFVVDALQQSWHVIAPDWRGYGESEWLGRPYWFPDYYADLHLLLQHYSPGRPARLVGHSMGANVAAIYAGSCPERVSQVVMLDFLGLRPAEDDAPALIGRWLRHLGRTPVRGVYPDREAFARRLVEMNPRLSHLRAEFLAQNLSHVLPDGSLQVACDPWHRIPSPLVYHPEDNLASWQKIVAPVLLLVASHGFVVERFGHDPEEYQRRTGCFRNLQVVNLADSGHNVQHDQPERVAEAIEGFLGRD